MASVAGLLKDLPKLKERMTALKERLSQQTVTGETGGGAVRVTATGLLRVVSIEVDPAMLAGLVDSTDPQDKAMAEGLIAGAVNMALQKARELAEKEAAAAAGELGLPLPPGILGGLMS
ncbi:MAG: YbaB/EbfC family nucleoid-associated protein [Planctomycetota bacterium]|nr:MAG: YbaB/EbfC family nucleoid-associated protein [Planctomycetota bacterium]